MENHFLDDFVHQLDKHARLGSHKDALAPWYNRHGDCIEFQTVHEAYFADRIDDYLTIYRSVNSNEPIGFQIKDVLALIQTFGYDGLALRAETEGHKLLSLHALLFAAYESLTFSFNRRIGYALAARAIPQDGPQAEVAVAK